MSLQNPMDAQRRLPSLKLRLELTGGLHSSDCGANWTSPRSRRSPRRLTASHPTQMACVMSSWTCGLTFMDASGLHELIRQNDYGHRNRHNLAVVRGRKAIQRLLELTAVEEILVMVDDPEDLAPPPPAPTG